LFWWLQRRLLWNGGRLLARKQRLRFGLIISLVCIIWGGLLALFIRGFIFLRDLDKQGPISFDITALLFGIFFLSVTALTVFSTGLLLYGNLFRHPEAWFLMATPVRSEHIFAYKFQEALLFSGWSFLLLGTPLLLAYGLVMDTSWLYFVLFPFYLLGFLLLPAAIGALACLLIVNYAHNYRKIVLALLVGAVVLAVVAWFVSAAQGARFDYVTEKWVRRLIDHLQPTRHSPPGAWMTDGLIAAGMVRGTPADWWHVWWHGNDDRPHVDLEPLVDAFYYLLLIWAYGLFSYLVCAGTAKGVYRSAFDRAASAGGRRRRYRASLSDRLVALLVRWRDRKTQLFVLKDWRSFRRDPSQWGQVVLLGGILLLYLVNIRNLPHGNYPLNQRALIGLLNVAVIGLMMATYTSRFVFPMMSLEGRNFWILGLLPIQRDRLLTSKFTYAGTFTLTLSGTLVVLSELMLRLPWSIMILHVAASVLIALGLSALSVGLGAYLVNLKETNPSKIAAGFGGTMNLLISLGFAVTVVTMSGLPTLLYFGTRPGAEIYDFLEVWHWYGGCLAVMAVVGILAIWLPMRLGMHAFRQMEF
jgi:ABC-2 type transport system permease protein